MTRRTPPGAHDTLLSTNMPPLYDEDGAYAHASKKISAAEPELRADDFNIFTPSDRADCSLAARHAGYAAMPEDTLISAR